MRTLRTVLATTAAAAAVALALPGQAMAAPAEPTAWECASGNVCFWTGYNGTGKRCAWSVADPDWQSGNIKCSWAATTNVRSVWNRGTSSSYTGVAYYRNTDYNGRIGCTRQGQRGNLAGTYKVRSHRWIDGNCG